MAVKAPIRPVPGNHARKDKITVIDETMAHPGIQSRDCRGAIGGVGGGKYAQRRDSGLSDPEGCRFES